MELRRERLSLRRIGGALGAEATRRGISKAALVRELVRQSFEQPRRDPVDDVIGVADGEPVGDIDAAIYRSR
jgi:hypothetical protein